LTPPLFGAGLIDAISEDAILANADPDDQDGDGISGRANRIKGRVGRFGWKAHEARLEDFAARAMLEEMGVTTPLLPEETSLPGRGAECDATPDPEDDGAELAALTGFLRLLAPLEARASELADRRGAELFRASGCPGCHVGELPGPSGNAPGNGTPVRLFSDLLLHDMGPSLADGIVQGDASGREFRTAPLWGVAQRKAYLHDGRAPTLNAAIALHDGEAKGARERFLALGMEERQALIAYLETL
jgi:CxxC motif-containing protein (DUF1111 family)